ncbi:flagellar biosynthesis protein FlhA [Marinomonas mediterranea]|uniref:flagellar biosynthesis protein FlhA n=1 Tax=Marinomonas mediterranea TaxID=119864 RepID=UPI002348EF07|nr:flagellar biosynthesis protein FlhA [Marinomonas mediterranea]WCN10387.1 flagellar biosynthesis protein FlhA [Marinomonas mediterranea]WCN14433.1 flagellar biosynthesis protein FlhA [Marinomonas mediterranea]
MEFDRQRIIGQARGIVSGNLGVPFILLALLAMMILPLPAFLLDVLFTFNIALAIVVLLVAIYSLRPLDFAVFPTVLLISTLMRLALNVASTRVVLLYGHEGGDAAGKVIEAFGEVVIGGNYVVGFVVFAILMIINFAVVTKGAGRISEVSARFTLDAMPGKQMAIDADLNAGMIDADQARERRSEIASEAEFYGSMDGASKFVKGDAVAGLLILGINIIGGLAIGMAQHGLSFSDAVERYSLLTIGDGLVAQLPSLMLSTAAAIMVTRVNESGDMGTQVYGQMFGSTKALYIAAAIMTIMGIVPGMPHFSFLSLAAALGGLAYFLEYRKKKQAQTRKPGSTVSNTGASKDKTAPEQKDLSWEDVAPVDMLGLEVGYRLIPLVDKSQGGELLARIKGVRRKLSQDLGFLVPSVHIRDNLDLMPNAYRITLMGVSLAEAEVHPDKELAIDPGQVFGKIDGIPGKDPSFGLEAVWIDPKKRDQAQTYGYTVVDVSTVVATHINQVMFKHSYELIGHDEVQQLLGLLKQHNPKLAEELVPNAVPLSVLLKVLQNLLIEGVPLRDMRTIAEAIMGVQPKTQDPMVLTAAVRTSLSRMIIQTLADGVEEIPVLTLDPQLEKMLMQTVQQSQQAGVKNEEALILEPSMAEQLQSSLKQSAEQQEAMGNTPILVVSAPIRPMLARFMRFGMVNMAVLSYQEVPDHKRIAVVGVIGQ